MLGAKYKLKKNKRATLDSRLAYMWGYDIIVFKVIAVYTKVQEWCFKIFLFLKPIFKKKKNN